MSGELKPCPVCGNRAFLSITGVPGHRSVWCLTDGCLRMAPRETAEEATAAWNTRAELSSLRGDCRNCGGDGITRDDNPCMACGGSGKRPTPDSDVIGRLVGALADFDAADLDEALVAAAFMRGLPGALDAARQKAAGCTARQTLASIPTPDDKP